MLRILHAADLHLGAPCQGLRPEQAHQRRNELLSVPERLRLLAANRQVDLVLLPGDLFDRPAGLADEAAILARALGRMKVPVFISPGNHDYYTAASPYAAVNWPQNVHLFTESRPETVNLPKLGCKVTGAAFTAPHQEISLLSRYAHEEDGLLSLLCIHGEVGEVGRYNAISPDWLPTSGFRYAALGHNHTYGGMKEFGSTAVAWPGCPEAHGFDECGEKGVLYVELDEDHASAEFIPLCQRTYHDITLDVSEFDTPEDGVRSILPPKPSNDIIRLTLTGTAPEGCDLTESLRLLEQQYYSAQLSDYTAIRRDIWSRLQEDSLTGEFLRQAQRKLAAASPEDKPMVEQAVRFGLAALEGRTVIL